MRKIIAKFFVPDETTDKEILFDLGTRKYASCCRLIDSIVVDEAVKQLESSGKLSKDTEPYRYFVSYECRENAILSKGACEILRDRHIKVFDDIVQMQSYMKEKMNIDDVLITNWRRFEE